MPRKWTPEKVAKESKKYRIKTYFEKQSSGAYKAAVRLGILDEVCSHMKNLRETWTPEKVAKESKKYNRRIDFNAGSGSAYNAATRLGILDEVCSHMEVIKETWTPEKITKEAKKYNRKIDFKKQSCGAYKAARRLGILDEVCSHMEVIKETWTPEKITKEVKKYNKRSDFHKNSPGAYEAARRLGILDEVCSHMESYLSAVYMFSTEFKNNTIWKIGASITVEKALARIKKISRISKLGSPKNILMLSVEDGLVTENKLLKFGKPVEFENRFDSCTEFRELTDDELKEMYNILLDDGVFINHLSRI